MYDALVTDSINSGELLGEVHHEGHSQLLPVHRGADLGKDKTQDVLKQLDTCFQSRKYKNNTERVQEALCNRGYI